jgi:hypothetical protein
MRESRTYGFVRGAHSDMRPYRDPKLCLSYFSLWTDVADGRNFIFLVPLSSENHD